MKGKQHFEPHLRRFRFFLLLGIAGLSAAIAAQLGDLTNAHEKREPRSWAAGRLVGADADPLALGKQLYAKHCESCHGESGKGDGPAAQGLEKEPGNLADPQNARKSDQALFGQISKGKKPMPSFESKLTEQERWALVHYIRTLAKSK